MDRVLLLIDVVNAYHMAIVQTVWAPAEDRLAGRRVTETESFQSIAQLSARLAELLPLISAEILPAVPAAPEALAA